MIAIQCPENDHYHVQAENLYVEVINEDGAPCRPGEIGRMVLSDLHNFTTPMIRYEIGDYAEVGEACAYGRGLPVLNRTAGRVRNMLTLPSGDKFWPSFPEGEMMPIALIRQFQVIQHDLERVEAKLVTARTLSGDWFYPMDLATINEDRYVFLKRRADDIISTDGIKFYPIEVENVLMSHPDVTAAAVFDWPHPRYGQVPVAAITNSAPITHNDRVAYYGRQIAPYKIPGSFMFLPEMPRNSMGKILKSRLKEMLKQELAKQS